VRVLAREGFKAFQCFLLIGVNFEDGEKLHDVEGFVNLIGGVDYFEMTAVGFDRAQAVHQLADTGAVHVSNAVKIEQDISLILSQQRINDLLQLPIPGTQNYLPHQV